MTQAPPALTTDIRLDAYASLLQRPEWLGSMGVSLQVSIFTTVLALGLGSLAAYPLARYRVPFRAFVVAALIATQTLPAIVIAIPVLLIFQAVQLKDTVAALVLVDLAFLLPLVVWLLRNAFAQVPRAIESAARIDGCSRVGTLFRVTIPAAMPGIASVAILTLVGTWNEFRFAVTLGDREAVTITRRIGMVETLGGVSGSPPFTLIAGCRLCRHRAVPGSGRALSPKDRAWHHRREPPRRRVMRDRTRRAENEIYARRG